MATAHLDLIEGNDLGMPSRIFFNDGLAECILRYVA